MLLGFVFIRAARAKPGAPPSHRKNRRLMFAFDHHTTNTHTHLCADGAAEPPFDFRTVQTAMALSDIRSGVLMKSAPQLSFLLVSCLQVQCTLCMFDSHRHPYPQSVCVCINRKTERRDSLFQLVDLRGLRFNHSGRHRSPPITGRDFTSRPIGDRESRP